MIKTVPAAETLNKAAILVAAMANEKRLLILVLISKQEMSVNALAQAVHLSQSALSQHLAKLRKASLVTVRRDAQTLYYSSKNVRVERMLRALSIVYAGPIVAQPAA